MNEMQQAAYIMAMAACAQVEAIGMAASNAAQLARGGSGPPLYTENDFEALITKYGIHHNAVIAFFNGSR